MNWNNLNILQKSDLMKIYLKHGISSLDEMKEHYNSFGKGGSTDDPPFVQRFADGRDDELTQQMSKRYNIRPLESVISVSDNTRVVGPTREEVEESKKQYEAEERQKVINNAKTREPQLKADTRSKELREASHNAAINKEIKQRFNEQASIYGRALGANHDMTVDEVNTNTASTTNLATSLVNPMATIAALGTGYLVDKSINTISDGAYNNWGDLMSAKVGGPSEIYELTNPGYIVGFKVPHKTFLAVNNFKLNRNLVKNESASLIDSVWENFLERSKRPSGVYAHAEYLKTLQKSNGTQFNPLPNDIFRPKIDPSLNVIKYMFEGEPILKFPIKKALNNLLNVEAYNDSHIIHINPLKYFYKTPKHFKGLIGHESQHSIQQSLPLEYRLAMRGNGYFVNNQNNKYTKASLQPFERNSGNWKGSPNELDAEIIRWKMNRNIPLTTDFISMDAESQKEFVDLVTKRFELKEYEAYNILNHLSRNGYFGFGGQI